MMQKLKPVFLIAFFLFVPISLLQSQNNRADTILILHTNDMHAKIDELPKLAYLADSLRARYAHVLLVSAGDNFTGNPVVDMVNDKGYPMIDLMNRCGFDVSVIGNHEFDLGQNLLEKRFEQAKFPFILANIDASGGKIRQPEPYKVLEGGNNSRLVFLGLIHRLPNNFPDAYPLKMEGLKFSDPFEKAKEYAGLKKQYGILIALSHLGFPGDSLLAVRMPEFDLIIGGHTHMLIDSVKRINGVPIVQAGSNLKYIGKTILVVRDGKVVSCRNENIPVSMLKGSNAEMAKMVEQYNDVEELKKVAGFAEAPVTGPDELGSMMTDAITHRMKVDFAFQNRGGIRTQSLPAGEITYKEIYKLDPFGNLIKLYTMKPAEIRSLICNAFNRGRKIDLDVSGMRYVVKVGADGRCTDVVLADRSGQPLDENHDYSVGMNSYVADTYEFTHADPGIYTTLTSAQALIEYLQEVHKVNYKGTKRVSVESAR